jgi:hypothetical protein
MIYDNFYKVNQKPELMYQYQDSKLSRHPYPLKYGNSPRLP